MRTTYLLDRVRRRRAGALGASDAAGAEANLTMRRRRWGLAAAVLLGAGLVVAGWALWSPLGRTTAPAPAAAASVPAHQWSGPMANPYGNGPAVVAERGVEAPASAAGAGVPVQTANATSATSAAGASTGASAASAGANFTTPAARQAVAAALARWRAGPRGGEFVTQALQSGEPAALLVAWMASRQCQEVAQWRLVTEWRYRATTPGARAEAVAPPPLPAGTSASLRSLAARCVDMPDQNQVDTALAGAGFAATNLPEPTRRPLDLSAAASLGDPGVLAAVVDATPLEDLIAWVTSRNRGPSAAPTQPSLEVLRGAFWLASCQGSGAGSGGSSAATRPNCQDHPAVWQACTQQGLCDGRDLHDVLLRTLPADVWHASDRLARELAPLLGR